MKNKLDDILHTIVATPELHACWLETLSHLELQGAKKIMNFLPNKFPSIDLLQHAYEETRHAYFFKKKVSGVCKLQPSQERLLGAGFCQRYVHIVDLSVSKCLKARLNKDLLEFKTACYYLSSYIIEVRALEIYKTYNKIIKQNNISWNLNSLIAEESQHLSTMHRWILTKNDLKENLNAIKIAEQKIYMRFLVSLEKNLYKYERSQHLAAI
jgi:hypothetical protein